MSPGPDLARLAADDLIQTETDVTRSPAIRVTLADVARLAAVSPVTVSRVLRKSHIVSDDLKAKVMKAVTELGYIPNQMASGLASSRTGRVGVIVPSLTNGVFNDYLRAIHSVFVPAGIQVMVVNSRYLPGLEESVILSMLGQFPEAVIIAGVDQTERARRALLASGIPVVQTMELTDAPIDINIGLSQRDAAYAATRYLLGLGHTHIAHISAPMDSRSLKRIEGYGRAMQDGGAAQTVLSVDEPSSIRYGMDLFSQVLADAPDTTAVFCGNDNLALGALFACQRRGIQVPQEMSIMGFNDLELAQCSFPALTTIATPRVKMAQQASTMVLDLIRHGALHRGRHSIDLGFDLIVRESTCPPGKLPNQ